MGEALPRSPGDGTGCLVGAARTAQSAVQVSGQDRKLLQMPHQSNMAEIADRKLAQPKGQSEEVKSHGAMTVADHTKLDATRSKRGGQERDVAEGPNAEQRAMHAKRSQRSRRAVGVRRDGSLILAAADQVGWWIGGAQPADPRGTTVLAGHVDDATGRHGALYPLQTEAGTVTEIDTPARPSRNASWPPATTPVGNCRAASSSAPAATAWG
jgi:hypothetical protein